MKISHIKGPLTVDIGAPLVFGIVPDTIPNKEPLSMNCLGNIDRCSYMSYMYTYICIETQRERERERDTYIHTCLYIWIYVYIYIYICAFTHMFTLPLHYLVLKAGVVSEAICQNSEATKS